MPEERDSSIILSGGDPDQTAPVLARLFGIAPQLAAQIVRASPIVLVESLTAGQAAGVNTALNELMAAGAQIAIKIGPVGSIPKVGWGGVPSIAGKPATEYSASAASEGSFTCPCCGAAFKLVRTTEAAAPAPAAAHKAVPQKGGKDSGFEQIPLPDALKALETAPELPDVPEVPAMGAGQANPATTADANKGAFNPKQMKPGASGPMALEDFEAGLASDDNLLSDLDDGLPDVPDEPPKPVPMKPAAHKSAVPPTKPAIAPKGAVLKVSGLDDIQGPGSPAPAAAPAKPVPQPAQPAKQAPTKPPAAKSSAPSGGADERFNIFANRSNNPRMVELIAKIRGVSEEEATELAQKPLVTIARNISRKQADVIRQKFAESKITVRLSPANPSQRTQAQEG